MAGLLDFFGSGWEDPKSNAVMALAGGLLDGDFASGVKGYSQAMAGAKDAQLKRAMQQAQIDNMQSEIKDRDNKVLKQAQRVEADKRFYGGGNENRMSDGAFLPSAGYGPTMPIGMYQEPKRAGLANKSIEEVLQFMSEGGSDKALDAYKWAKDLKKLEQGATYVDPITNKERFMPKVGEGGVVDAQGNYNLMPGYANSQGLLEAAKAGATARGKAPYEFTTQTLPGDRTVMGTNAQLLEAVNSGGNPFTNQPAPMQPRSQSPAGSEANIIAQGMGGLNGLPTTARGGNVSMRSTPAEMDAPRILQDAFQEASARWEAANKLGDSASMNRAKSDIEGIRGEFAKLGGARPQSLAPNTAPQSAPSFGLQLQSPEEKGRKAAEVEAYKTKLVEQAKADVVPTQAKQANIASAQNALSVIDKALAHPGLGVATGLSGAIDPRNYVPGQVGKDYKSIQNQLEGKAFLSAFEQLKGGGAISEKEGEKAQQAIARMSLSQSEKEYRQGLKDYKEVIQTGLSRMKGEDPKKQETKSLQEYGYKSNDDVLRDAKNTIMRNPQSKAEVERRLQSMGLSLGGR